MACHAHLFTVLLAKMQAGWSCIGLCSVFLSDLVIFISNAVDNSLLSLVKKMNLAFMDSCRVIAIKQPSFTGLA